MNNEWVLLKKASELTGYTTKALMRKIENGYLPVGVVSSKKFGRWHINMKEFNLMIRSGDN